MNDDSRIARLEDELQKFKKETERLTAEHRVAVNAILQRIVSQQIAAMKPSSQPHA